jgi:DNA-binding transcriptional MerR regulator
MYELLMTADVAKILGVVPATIRWMERTGRIVAQRTPSGVRLFRRADVERVAFERVQRRARVGCTESSLGDKESKMPTV